MVGVSDADFSTAQLETPNRVVVSLTVASGDTRVVAVVHLHAPTALNAVTFDGNAMTQITGSPFGTDPLIAGYFYDCSGMSPGTYELRVTETGGFSDDTVVAGYVLSDAEDPTDWTEDTGAGTTLIDIAVPSAADGLVIWAISQDVDATLTPNGGETEVYDGAFTVPAHWYYGSGYYEVAVGATTTSNIAMTSGDWTGVGFFIPSAGGGEPPAGETLMGQACL